MGTVYEARDLERDERVALKLLSRVDAKGVYRLKREFRSLAGISHPGLVTLGQLFCEHEQWFFSMELIDGGVPFDAWVSAEGTPDESRLRGTLAQLVAAVKTVHAAGYLHCDIKPSNVLVEPSGRVVLLDFGLASATVTGHEDLSAETGLVGTPAYLAPEQAAGATPIEASDYYAVGVMLFVALTGRLPFVGNPLQVLRSKQEQRAPNVRELARASQPALDLCALCDALLERDPCLRLSGDALWEVLAPHASGAIAPAAGAGRPVTVPPPMFVGRESELATLRAAFAAMRAGTTRHLLIAGRSGVGKSALLERFVSELDARVLVLRGRCHEQESVPYQVFDSVVDALTRRLRNLSDSELQALLPRHVASLLRLFPGLGRVAGMARAASQATPPDPRALRSHAFSALKELLLRLTDRTPVVIAVDDLQWGDVDSARMMAHVLGSPDSPPLLFLGAFRSEDAQRSAFLSALMSPLTHSDGARPTVIGLGPLAPFEAERLARAMLEREGVAPVLAPAGLAAEAGGVPYLIGELVEHLKLRARKGADASSTAIVLERALLDRIADRDAESQRLLQVLAVAAGPIEQSVAFAASELPRSGPAALRSLRASRLARTSAGLAAGIVETYHDRIRETVVASLTPSETSDIHARLATALEAHGIEDAERLIAHYAGAGNHALASSYAARAAQAAAQKLAFNRAAELYGKAIELLPSGQASASALFQALGDALANAGRGGRAAEAYLAAAHGLPAQDARRLQRLATQQYLRSGRFEEGTALARQLFRELDLPFPESESHALVLYAWYSVRAKLSRADLSLAVQVSPGVSERVDLLEATFREYNVIDLPKGAALRAMYSAHARSAGDMRRVMHGLAWEAWVAAMNSHSPRAAARLLWRVEQLATRLDTPYARATVLAARAGCALFLRRMNEVIDSAVLAEQMFSNHCPGSDWERNLVSTYRATAIEQVGGFKAIFDEAPGRLIEALDRDDRFALSYLVLTVPFTHLARDRPDQALAFLEEQSQRLPPAYRTFNVYSVARTVHTLLYAGDAEAALKFMDEALPAFRASFWARGRFYATTMLSLEARAALAVAHGDRRRRAELLNRAARSGQAILDRNRPHTIALHLLVQAGISNLRGDHEKARMALSQCAEGAARHQSPMLACYAQRSLGVLIGGSQGEQLKCSADARLVHEGVHDPKRWSQIWIHVEPD